MKEIKDKNGCENIKFIDDVKNISFKGLFGCIKKKIHPTTKKLEFDRDRKVQPLGNIVLFSPPRPGDVVKECSSFDRKKWEEILEGLNGPTFKERIVPPLPLSYGRRKIRLEKPKSEISPAFQMKPILSTPEAILGLSSSEEIEGLEEVTADLKETKLWEEAQEFSDLALELAMLDPETQKSPGCLSEMNKGALAKRKLYSLPLFPPCFEYSGSKIVFTPEAYLF